MLLLRQLPLPLLLVGGPPGRAGEGRFIIPSISRPIAKEIVSMVADYTIFPLYRY